MSLGRMEEVGSFAAKSNLWVIYYFRRYFAIKAQRLMFSFSLRNKFHHSHGYTIRCKGAERTPDKTAPHLGGVLTDARDLLLEAADGALLGYASLSLLPALSPSLLPPLLPSLPLSFHSFLSPFFPSLPPSYPPTLPLSFLSLFPLSLLSFSPSCQQTLLLSIKNRKIFEKM